jgi:hypothetical protein
VGTDVAKDVDDLPRIGIVLDVKGKYVFQRDVAFPYAWMTLHLANAQRRMKGRIFCSVLKASKRLALFL